MTFIIIIVLLCIFGLMAVSHGGRIILLGIVAIIGVPAVAFLFYLASGHGAAADSDAPPPPIQSSPSPSDSAAGCGGASLPSTGKPADCGDTHGASDVTGISAAALAPSPMPAGQPALDTRQIEQGVDELQALIPAKGLSGAADAAQQCYAALGSTPAWAGWDRCAAMDEAGFKAFNPYGLQPSTNFFSRPAIDARETKALASWSADATANRERMTALRVMAARALSSIAERAAERAGVATTRPPAAHLFHARLN